MVVYMYIRMYVYNVYDEAALCNRSGEKAGCADIKEKSHDQYPNICGCTSDRTAAARQLSITGKHERVKRPFVRFMKQILCTVLLIQALHKRCSLAPAIYRSYQALLKVTIGDS